MVNSLPGSVEQETQFQSLGEENLLEEERAIIQVFLPGKSHGQRRLEGYSPWGHKKSDTTEHACMHNNLEMLFRV